MTQPPDRFSFDGGATFINATVGGLDPSNANNGDWEWDNANNEIKFIGKLLDNICRPPLMLWWVSCTPLMPPVETGSWIMLTQNKTVFYHYLLFTGLDCFRKSLYHNNSVLGGQTCLSKQ